MYLAFILCITINNCGYTCILSVKNVDFLGKCECRSAKSTTIIAIAAVTREVCCIGAMCKGALLEVVTGMSNVHSLGDMLINLIIVVERHIVVVECVYAATSAAIELQDSREGSLPSLTAATACSNGMGRRDGSG